MAFGQQGGGGRHQPLELRLKDPGHFVTSNNHYYGDGLPQTDRAKLERLKVDNKTPEAPLLPGIGVMERSKVPKKGHGRRKSRTGGDDPASKKWWDWSDQGDEASKREGKREPRYDALKKRSDRSERVDGIKKRHGMQRSSAVAVASDEQNKTSLSSLSGSTSLSQQAAPGDGSSYRRWGDSTDHQRQQQQQQLQQLEQHQLQQGKGEAGVHRVSGRAAPKRASPAFRMGEKVEALWLGGPDW